ncbi:class I SAM-dependent DNA methyltransferase [Microbispora sp. H10949]|uniref:type I restriction-modification system subunit M n=1 Tax=Microbispora sp. H10949 TaxID=2729111 RepID=UPI002873D12A|nr:class I SAM-dependent DNA methyltransferase [Microbispora sp. H10949]
METTHRQLAGLIWKVADLLRGDYKQSEYGKVILPFTVLRRMDCVMAPTRALVWEKDKAYDFPDKDELICDQIGLRFFNRSKQSFETIGAAPADVRKNLQDYVNGFSSAAREIIDKYDFHRQIVRLDNAGLLYKVVQAFAGFPLSPAQVDNHGMGYVFEELIRKFADASNETAGEHFTPREVIELMVNLLLAPDLGKHDPGDVINILDPACGTGGMLSAAEEHIRAQSRAGVNVEVFGQELNEESYAICRSDMMMKDHDPANIRLGNSFSDDKHKGRTFDYMLANPPFGVEWKKVEDAVKTEHEVLKHSGRFGAGLPRINDGSFLFLQHMISKMRPASKGGTRLAIVFNGSPLFTGGAGSGESEIRRWILERDLLETIVALPDQLFYNTGISTYFWILSNRKDPSHKGKVVLLDARDYWAKMRKSLGEKRKEITEDQIFEITKLYGEALDAAADPEHWAHGKVKVFDNEDFGYQRITIDRPLRQRFEVTEETLKALAEAKAFAAYAEGSLLIEAFKPLIGTAWPTRAEARATLAAAAAEGGVLWPGVAADKAIWNAVAVTDPEGEVQTKKGAPLPDPDLRDYENVPLKEDIDEYFAREVLPHVPDAWIAETKNPKTGLLERFKIGYEIPFTRHFYVYTPPRPLSEIDAELKELESQIQSLLGEATA